MMKIFLPTILVITALWLLSRSIRRRKKSRSISDEASPSQRGGFDVFLNFRGPDSRHTVADVLYHTLTDAGVRVFLDDESIRKGEVIEGELLVAITNSRIYIPIFSKDYASSKWCLRELAKMIDCWQCSSGQEKKVILPIFYDVSVTKDVKLRSELYTSSLKNHKQELGKDIVESWEGALGKVARIKGWNLQDLGLTKLANLIKQRVLSDVNANEGVSGLANLLIGILEPMKDIMQLLQVGTPGVRFIVIHGMGGIGKTTLADAVFENISSSFQDSCVLKDVRQSSSVHDMVKLQQKLLSDTLSLKKPMEVSNIHDGISKISRRLRNHKVLIVLDDVDKWDHLQNLAANSDWFHPKSRIIITTRNTNFLPTKDNKDYHFYEMKEMDPNCSLQLFCRHAFGSNSPPPKYHDISTKIVATTGGLPLALEVIGASLHGEEEDMFQFRLDELKKAPHKDVQKKLMISYQALEDEQRQIFLDIACFFNNEKMRDPIYFWEACNLHPRSMIKFLVRRSLIKVKEHEKLWMHDQLRDLGREIAHPKTQNHDNKIQAKPSRLWSPEVALDVIQKKELKRSIVAIELGGLDDGCCFGSREFKKAVNLKFLRVQGGNFEGDFKNVFHQLRWLSWFDCPAKIEPTNFCFMNLAVIKLSGSHITDDWTGWGAITAAKQLRVMHLRECTQLTKTPSFSAFLGLERLIFIDCRGLQKIDWSINKLQHLDYLEIKTHTMDVRARPDLLPPSIGDLKSLTTLDVVLSGLTELHPSIGELTALVKLVISEPKIRELPNSIGNLRQLKLLRINHCLVEFLPDSIGRLESLDELDLEHTKITQLPENVGNLKRLKVLNLSFTFIKVLPKALGELESLEELHASSCRYLDGELPEEIGRLSYLRILDLGYSKITRVPASIKQLFHLQRLCLYFKSPESLRLPDLSGMTNLVFLSLSQKTYHYLSHGTTQPHVETTGIDWLTRLQKLEYLELILKDLIFPPTDLSSLHQLRKLTITCFNPRCLARLPSGLQTLRLLDVMSPINWKLLSSLNNLSSLTLDRCWLREIIVDSPGHLRSLKLSGSERLRRLSNLSYLKELRELEIGDCPNLVDVQGLGELDFLQSLSVERCDSIRMLPDLSSSKKLEKLSFRSCGSLERIPAIHEKAQCDLTVKSCGNIPEYSSRSWKGKRPSYSIWAPDD